MLFRFILNAKSFSGIAVLVTLCVYLGATSLLSSCGSSSVNTANPSGAPIPPEAQINEDAASKFISDWAAGNSAAAQADHDPQSSEGMTFPQIAQTLQNHGSVSNITWDYYLHQSPDTVSSDRADQASVGGTVTFSDNTKVTFMADEKLRNGHWLVSQFTLR